MPKGKIRYLWMGIWLAFYFVGFEINCAELLGNKGFHIIGNQYWRFFTGLLCHADFFHVIMNIAALYWTGYFLEDQISEMKLMFLATASGMITNILFSAVYRDSISIGGSPVVFSMIGILCILQLVRTDLPRFRLGSKCGKWIAGYAVLGNIPVFSRNISTFMIHLTAFCAGLLLGYISVKMDMV